MGFGEASVSPAAVKAFLDQPNLWIWNCGVRELLIGETLDDPAALWSRLYQGNSWSARNGIGHVALAGVDMALWDLAGKAAGLPVWKLLGGESPRPVMPYVTMYEGPSPLNETIARTLKFVDRVREDGFRAAKIEAGPERTSDADAIVALVKAVRDYAGEDLILLCDLCYRWADPQEALACIRRLEEFDLYLLEAPLAVDNVTGYREIATSSTSPIAGAETLTSFAEFADLLDSGDVAILQPAVSRLGITETDRLARYAQTRDRRIVPFGWVATTIPVAATLHVATVNENVSLVEYAPPVFYPDAVLRREIAGPEPEVRNAMLEASNEPGLGVVVDEDALRRWQKEHY
jgi:L-rhamnonate dehydratase